MLDLTVFSQNKFCQHGLRLVVNSESPFHRSRILTNRSQPLVNTDPQLADYVDC